MEEETSWLYNDQHHGYRQWIEGCTASVWQEQNGTWATSIESELRYSTARDGFPTLEEAQAWAIAEGVPHVLAQEEPNKERDVGE